MITITARLVSSGAAPENRAHNVILNVILVVVGLGLFAAVIRAAHARFRRRNKNGWWLIIFFGPLVAACFALEALLGLEQKVIMVCLIITGIIAGPPAIWGAAELTRRTRA